MKPSRLYRALRPSCFHYWDRCHAPVALTTKRRHLRSTSKADDSQSKRQSKSFFVQVEVAKPTDDKADSSLYWWRQSTDRVMNKRERYSASKLISERLALQFVTWNGWSLRRSSMPTSIAIRVTSKPPTLSDAVASAGEQLLYSLQITTCNHATASLCLNWLVVEIWILWIW
jgi:hypothetical protein